MQVREKVGKSQNTVFFPMICGSGGSKSTYRSQNVQNTRFGPLLEVEMSKKRTPLWREAHFEATFGGSDVVSRGRCKGLCTFSKVSKT